MSVWLKLLLQLFGLFLMTLNLDKEQRPSIPLQASPLWECFWVCEKEIASSLARMKCVEGGRLKPVRLERNCGLNWNLLFRVVMMTSHASTGRSFHYSVPVYLHFQPRDPETIMGVVLKYNICSIHVNWGKHIGFLWENPVNPFLTLGSSLYSPFQPSPAPSFSPAIYFFML